MIAAAVLPGCSVATGSISGRVVGSAAPSGNAAIEPLVVFACPVDRPAQQARGTATVRSVAGAFEPPFVAIAAGQSVRFVNDDSIYHRVFSSSVPNAFDLGPLCRGKSAAVRFEQPGTVAFYCSLHDGERGLIFVAPSPHFATVGPAGEFQLAELRPGRYELKTWSERAAAGTTSITVGAGPSSIDLPLGDASEAK